MQTDESFDTGALHNALQDAVSTVTVAEAHGSLCGLLCAPADEDDFAAWSEHLLGREQAGRPLLESFRAATEQEIESIEFRFTPLLPDDECSLQERGLALVDWCAGFLFGFALGHGRTESLSADGREFLHDLKEICRLSVPEDPDDDDERSYAELVEYVKTGVLLMRQLRRGPLS